MHMWGANLLYHPHIHTLSTCGRLDADHNWHSKKDGFFLPGKAMARLFKGYKNVKVLSPLGHII